MAHNRGYAWGRAFEGMVQCQLKSASLVIRKDCAKLPTWIKDVLRITAAAFLNPRQLAGGRKATVGGRGRWEGHGTLGGRGGGKAGQEGGGQATQGSHWGQLVDSDWRCRWR